MNGRDAGSRGFLTNSIKGASVIFSPAWALLQGMGQGVGLLDLFWMLLPSCHSLPLCFSAVRFGRKGAAKNESIGIFVHPQCPKISQSALLPISTRIPSQESRTQNQSHGIALQCGMTKSRLCKTIPVNIHMGKGRGGILIHITWTLRKAK